MTLEMCLSPAIFHKQTKIFRSALKINKKSCLLFTSVIVAYVNLFYKICVWMKCYQNGRWPKRTTENAVYVNTNKYTVKVLIDRLSTYRKEKVGQGMSEQATLSKDWVRQGESNLGCNCALAGALKRVVFSKQNEAKPLKAMATKGWGSTV